MVSSPRVHGVVRNGVKSEKKVSPCKICSERRGNGWQVFLAEQPERAGTCYFAGLKAVYKSFLMYQVLCHHSKYSLSGGQKRVQTGKNTVKYRIPALQGALHREILHVTQNPCDIMSVNMVGAIFPKDISTCAVVQEIARQIDHFTRERARPYDAE